MAASGQLPDPFALAGEPQKGTGRPATLVQDRHAGSASGGVFGVFRQARVAASRSDHSLP